MSMNKKNIVSVIISLGFICISLLNFLRVLNPILLIFNSIGFGIFVILLIVSVRGIFNENIPKD